MMMLLKLQSGTYATFLSIVIVVTIMPLINCLRVSSLLSPFVGTTFSSHCGFLSSRYHCNGSGTGNTVNGLVKCGCRRENRWGSWDGERSSAAECTNMRMTMYNPNDELRAIVQRKQLEVKNLLAAHTAADDRLQVNNHRKTDFDLIYIRLPV